MEFIFPVRVYYEDTDVAGVVYYANYLKFMERGRTEWLRSYGADQDVLIDQDVAFAVGGVELKYLKPARFNDALEVVTKIEKLGKASVHFYQQVRSADEPSVIYCQGSIKVVCVTMSNMQPRPIPKSLWEDLRRDS
ncbi:MAG: tol-pal system-associated acyl-CoA thioesterase [Kangiellaceae bacterium]|jgi:acyl-CoA thioester hydrolase|nr:tol-pal system-associated acyl-CoA thioesterase [Kangiellaceae bacterium]